MRFSYCLLLLTAFGSTVLYAQKSKESSSPSALIEDAIASSQASSAGKSGGLGQRDGIPIALSQTSGIILKPAPRLKTIHLRGVMPVVLRQTFQTYGIDLAFVAVPDLKRIRIDLGDADYFTALDVLEKMSHLLFVPLTETKVLAIADTEENRENYRYWNSEVIPLPHLDDDQKKSLTDFLQAGFTANAPILRDGSLTLRGDPESLAQIHSVIDTLLLPRPQILLDVKVYTVDYSYDREVGVKLPQQVKVFNVNSEITSLIEQNQSVVQELISEGLVTSGDTAAIAAALIALGYGSGTDLSSPFFYFGNGISLSGLTLSSASAALSFSSATTKEVKATILRLDDQQPAKLLIGSRYPVKTSSYNYAAGSSGSSSSSTALLASVEYEDLGMTFEVRPHILRDDDVLLHLAIKMQSLSGGSLNDIPILNRQEFSSDLTVPNSWSTVIASNISSQKVGEITGSGYVPTDTSKEVKNQELVIIVTPRLTRRANIVAANGPVLTPNTAKPSH